MNSFEDLTARVDMRLKIVLEELVELVGFTPGVLELHALADLPANFALDLAIQLLSVTGYPWLVSLTETRGMPPLAARRREAMRQSAEEVLKHPTVKMVMLYFPGAEIKSVRDV